MSQLCPACCVFFFQGWGVHRQQAGAASNLSIMFHWSLNRSHVLSKFHAILVMCLLICHFLGSSRSIDRSKIFLIRHVLENFQGTSPEQPRSFILQQANLAKSRVSQCWEAIWVNGCQYFWKLIHSMLFSFDLPLPWVDIPSCSPLQWGQDRGLSDAVRALGCELSCFSGWLLSANLQDFLA